MFFLQFTSDLHHILDVVIKLRNIKDEACEKRNVPKSDLKEYATKEMVSSMLNNPQMQELQQDKEVVEFLQCPDSHQTIHQVYSQIVKTTPDLRLEGRSQSLNSLVMMPNVDYKMPMEMLLLLL